jgi:hypothetical protein
MEMRIVGRVKWTWGQTHTARVALVLATSLVVALGKPAAAAPAAKPVVLFRAEGTASFTTNSFNVPRGDWTATWSVDCGSSSAFSFTVYQGVELDLNDPGPNWLGRSGSGSVTYGDSGTFNLNVLSVGCSWAIVVTRPADESRRGGD